MITGEAWNLVVATTSAWLVVLALGVLFVEVMIGLLRS